MLARFQEEPTHFSSQSDLFSDDKFWQHFRKRFNFGSKNQHPWTALWSKGLWEEETPSVVGWGRLSQGNAYSPTPRQLWQWHKDDWGQPVPLQWLGRVLHEWVFAVPCLQVGVSSGFSVPPCAALQSPSGAELGLLHLVDPMGNV